MNNFSKNMLMVLLIFTLAGCKVNQFNNTQSQIIKSAVLGGNEALPLEDADLLQSIVAIPFKELYCSGTLISANVVLTAAHCIDLETPQTIVFLGGKAPIFKNRNDKNENKYEIKKIISHPDYTGGNTYDIALIILKEKVKAPFKPMKINDGFDFIKKATPLVAAGFSIYSVAQANDIFDLFNNQLEEKYKYSNYEKDGSIKFLVKNVVMYDEVNPTPYDPNIKFLQISGGVCYGDSGGPTMIRSNDSSLFLVGINRAVNGTHTENYRIGACEYEAFSTSVSLYKEWINESIKEERAKQPKYVSSLSQKDLNQKEIACAKAVNTNAIAYTILQEFNKESCDLFAIKDPIAFLDMINKKCQDSCKDLKHFEGQCDFYIKGKDKMVTRFQDQCKAL